MSRVHNETVLREMDLARDLDQIKRIWREVGWTEDEDDSKQLDHFFAGGDTLVAQLGNEVECSVHTVEGAMRLQTTDLPLCAVTAVTTSRIARGHAFAQRLTAQQLRRGAQRGAAIAALGMFDQGFYNKVGFGTGAYEHRMRVDPDLLQVDSAVPTPRRLGLDDCELMHAALCRRIRGHGGVVLRSVPVHRAELAWDDGGFGLGYPVEGELTHFVWLEPKGEHGPYVVRWMGYENTDQLMELLGLLKSLSDQVYAFEMDEPPHIQLQALLRRPLRTRSVTRNSKFANEHWSMCWWQFRVLDVAACVAAVRTPIAVEFQLRLHDPIEAALARDPDLSGAWTGVGGEYVLELGTESRARAGRADLPVLEADVAAFSRLLWGVAPASSLAVTDTLSAPQTLLEMLDQAIVARHPRLAWDF